MIKTLSLLAFAGICAAAVPFPALAMESSQYRLDASVLNAASNTYTASGKQVYDSVAEPLVGQAYGRQYSVQAGFFNDYFLPAPTPTITCTPIRQFGGEILSEQYVYAAPNPIRGQRANIVYHLAERAEVEIKIFTITSQLVISKHWDSVPAGENHWYWNTSGIANGVYFLLVRAKGSQGRSTVIKKKIALVR